MATEKERISTDTINISSRVNQEKERAVHSLESEILILYTAPAGVPGGNMTSEADLTEDVRRLRISGSANCLDSPDRREMPAASRRASSLA